MNGYVNELEAALVEAGRRRQQHRRGFGGFRRVDLGAVTAVVSAAGAIAIAVLAIAVLGHHRTPVRPGGRTATIVPRIVRGRAVVTPVSALPLLSELAILRRPQTDADRRLAARFGGIRHLPFSLTKGSTNSLSIFGSSGPVIPSLTRLVASLPDGQRLFLAVGRAAASDGNGALLAGDIVAIVDVDGRRVSVGGSTTARDLAHELGAPVLIAHGDAFAIVPDHAAGVVFDLPGGSTLRATGVVHNVAAVPIPPNGNVPTGVSWALLISRPPLATTIPPNPHPGGKLLAQINLVAPRPGRRAAAGIAEVVREGGRLGIVIVAQHVVPNTDHNAYAVWLCRRATVGCKLIGFIAERIGRNGKLHTEGVLPSGADRYSRLVIALATNARPRRPGRIELAGAFPRNPTPSAGGG